MLKNKQLIGIGIAIGIIITTIATIIIQKPKNENKENNHYFILNNQINKMNKMVVIEQNFSFIQKNSVEYTILGKQITETKVITLTKTDTQVSYDLTKMKIKIDSVNKKLIIEEIPNPQIKIIPQVEIESINDSFLKRIKDTDLKKITENAKNTAIKKVNKEQLKTLGKEQLIKNLEQILVLAKTLNYQIIDNTHTIPKEKL